MKLLRPELQIPGLIDHYPVRIGEVLDLRVLSPPLVASRRPKGDVVHVHDLGPQLLIGDIRTSLELAIPFIVRKGSTRILLANLCNIRLRVSRRVLRAPHGKCVGVSPTFVAVVIYGVPLQRDGDDAILFCFRPRQYQLTQGFVVPYRIDHGGLAGNTLKSNPDHVGLEPITLTAFFVRTVWIDGYPCKNFLINFFI